MPQGVIDFDNRLARRVKLHELRVLVAVAQYGTMARAAVQLRMSQPSVSQAVANLEQAFGVRLFDRSPRGVEPTFYARVLLERTRVVFDELSQGVREVAFLANPTVGEATVGCPESLAAGFVPAAVERLSRRYPRVSIHVVLAQPGEQEFRELRERSVDVLLGRLFRPVVDDEIDVEVLADDQFFVTADARSAFARRRRIALADLMDAPWILFPLDSLSGKYIEAGFQGHGLGLPQNRLTSFSMQLRFHLLATGRYLTVLHHSVLAFNAKRWSLKALPVDLGTPSMPMAVFSLKGRTLSPVVQLFLEQVRAVARGMVSEPSTGSVK
jgi:DNA-binding transcriptional LysR family regulator